MDDAMTEDEKKYFIEYYQQGSNANNDEHQSKKQRNDNHDYQGYLDIKNKIINLYNSRTNDRNVLTFTMCRNSIANLDTGRLFKVYTYLSQHKIINKHVEIKNNSSSDDNISRGSKNSIGKDDNNSMKTSSIISNIEKYCNNEDDILSLHRHEITDLHKSLQSKKIELYKSFALKDIETNFSKEEIDKVQKLIPDNEKREIALAFTAIRNECQVEKEKEQKKLEDFINQYVALRYECLQQKVKLLEHVEQIIDIHRKRNENSRRDNQIDRARLASRLPGVPTITLK